MWNRTALAALIIGAAFVVFGLTVSIATDDRFPGLISAAVVCACLARLVGLYQSLPRSRRSFRAIFKDDVS